MTQDEIENGRKYLQHCIDMLSENRLKWWAISVGFNDGGRQAIHSKDAPKRPAGLA